MELRCGEVGREAGTHAESSTIARRAEANVTSGQWQRIWLMISQMEDYASEEHKDINTSWRVRVWMMRGHSKAAMVAW